MKEGGQHSLLLHIEEYQKIKKVCSETFGFFILIKSSNFLFISAFIVQVLWRL